MVYSQNYVIMGFCMYEHGCKCVFKVMQKVTQNSGLTVSNILSYICNFLFHCFWPQADFRNGVVPYNSEPTDVSLKTTLQLSSLTLSLALLRSYLHVR